MPERNCPPAGNRGATTGQVDNGQSTEFDGLAAQRKRRESAVRLPGGDPTQPGRKYHRPTVGLRASGFSEGFAAGIRWASRASAEEIADALGRAKAEGVS